MECLFLGKDNNRGSYGPEPSTSPYRESLMESRGFRQEMPPYRPPEVQVSQVYKPQVDKYGSLVETTGNRYHRERDLHQRERVNSLDKTNPTSFYQSSIHHRNRQDTGTGSVSRVHHGSVSLSEANVREKYGGVPPERTETNKSLTRGGAGVLTNVSKQRSLEVSERERDHRRTTCNNSIDRERAQISLISQFSLLLNTIFYFL